MRERKSTLAAEIDTIHKAYAALNQGDVPGFVHQFDTSVERIEEFPSGGTYRGLAEVTEHVAKARGTWAEGGCDPQRFCVAGNRVIVFTDVRVRLKNEMQWREGRIADVYTFRNGKVIEFRTFGDEHQALQWAGVQVSDTSGDATGQTGAT